MSSPSVKNGKIYALMVAFKIEVISSLVLIGSEQGMTKTKFTDSSDSHLILYFNLLNYQTKRSPLWQRLAFTDIPSFYSAYPKVRTV